MTNNVIIGLICFFTILLVDRFVPIKVRWQRALVAAAIAASCVALWTIFSPL